MRILEVLKRCNAMIALHPKHPRCKNILIKLKAKGINIQIHSGVAPKDVPDIKLTGRCLGDYCCTRAHGLVLKDAIQKGYKYIAVLEDDVVLLNMPNMQIPADCTILFLDYILDNPEQPEVGCFEGLVPLDMKDILCTGISGSSAYIINLKSPNILNLVESLLYLQGGTNYISIFKCFCMYLIQNKLRAYALYDRMFTTTSDIESTIDTPYISKEVMNRKFNIK